jgi:hypothetical protein
VHRIAEIRLNALLGVSSTSAAIMDWCETIGAWSDRRRRGA